MVSVRHLDEAGPDVSEELLGGFVLGAVHFPSRHLTEAVLGPLEILTKREWNGVIIIQNRTERLCICLHYMIIILTL